MLDKLKYNPIFYSLFLNSFLTRKLKKIPSEKNNLKNIKNLSTLLEEQSHPNA